MINITTYIIESNKQKQLDILVQMNPMHDDVHTGIRTIDDINTFEEVMRDAQNDFDDYGTYSSYPDVSNDVLIKALKTGKIYVYSSYPIKNGTFVTPSKMQANDYAGNGKIYSKYVYTKDIAWITVDEGEYAKL